MATIIKQHCVGFTGREVKTCNGVRVTVIRKAKETTVAEEERETGVHCKARRHRSQILLSLL